MSHTATLLTQQEMANRVGATQSAISYILRGDRAPSRVMAVSLESATGVCREAWVWPERHWNPYMPFTEQTNCLQCENRIVHVKWLADYAQDCFDKNPDKLQALKDSIDHIYAWTGERRSLMVAVRKRVHGGWKLLYSGNENSPTKITAKKWPVMTETLDREEVFHVPIHPNDLPEKAVNERRFGDMLGVKTHITVPHKGFSLSVTTLHTHVLWSPKMIEEIRRFLRIVGENL